MSAWQRALQRETAAHVMAGGQACPVYGLPHWVCAALHLMTGVCRTVTAGRFERFGATPVYEEVSDVDESGFYRPWIAEHRCCPHGPGAIGSTYWSTAAASTLDPQQLSIQGGP